MGEENNVLIDFFLLLAIKDDYYIPSPKIYGTQTDPSNS